MASKTDEPRNCPGCADEFTPRNATASRYDHAVAVCTRCATFEASAISVGDRLVSPGHAVRRDKHDREQFNRRTTFMR